MKSKPVVSRERAKRDVDEALEYCLAEGTTQVALALIDDLEEAYAHICEQPWSGAPRYADELNIPGLRHQPLRTFPYQVFYLDRPDHIDVWRVLHARRDDPVRLQEG